MGISFLHKVRFFYLAHRFILNIHELCISSVYFRHLSSPLQQGETDKGGEVGSSEQETKRMVD